MGNTTIYKKLSEIQEKFNAPKDQYNGFGGYSYRNFEAMLDNLKPILSAYGLVLTTTNKLQECAGHVYVQSTCTLTDIETGESVSADSFAREDDTRKGMTGAQITGGCVSYASKYSLGLLLSVGTGQRDADSMDNRPQTQSRPQPQTRPTPPPQTRPTPPPQQPMQAPQYQAQQAPPMQYHAPAPQYTAPPMAPQQTAPQYQPPMPPQQPVTAPPVQQAQPMVQQPMQTLPQPPVQAPPQPQFSADGVKPQTPSSADAPKQTPPFTRKERPAPPQPQIAADAPAPARPPVPAPGQYSTTKIAPQSIPAEWDIPEVSRPEDLLPYEEDELPAQAGWMAIPEGVVEAELPFN